MADLRMGHESSSEEEEENGRLKRRKRERRRKKDETEVTPVDSQFVAPISHLYSFTASSFSGGDGP